MLRTTPLPSEFVPVTLHIGQWFCVIKSVFSSTMSPMEKFLDILTHFWRSCQGLDKFLSPPTPKLITEMLNSSPPTSTLQIRFLENPWWRHHHLCLHCEYIIWRYRHLTLSIIDCLNSQWSGIYYCLCFHHQCLQGFLIQAVSMCL